MFIRKEELQQSPAKLDKIKLGLLTKSSLIAGIGFIIICALGYLISFIYTKTNISPNSNVLPILSSIFLVGSIISMVWFAFSRKEWSYLGYFCLFTSFIISQAIGFSSLFQIFNSTSLLFLFGIAGAIMFVSGILIKILPEKILASLMKIFFVFITISFFFSLCSFFMFFFGFGYSSGNQLYFSISAIIGAIIAIFYNFYIIYQITRTDSFAAASEGNSSLKLPLRFGFYLLVSLVQTVWALARLMLIFGKR